MDCPSGSRYHRRASSVASPRSSCILHLCVFSCFLLAASCQQEIGMVNSFESELKQKVEAEKKDNKTGVMYQDFFPSLPLPKLPWVIRLDSNPIKTVNDAEIAVAQIEIMIDHLEPMPSDLDLVKRAWARLEEAEAFLRAGCSSAS